MLESKITKKESIYSVTDWWAEPICINFVNEKVLSYKLENIVLSARSTGVDQLGLILGGGSKPSHMRSR